MTFASIMVSVDLAGDAGGRIAIAARLADAVGARTIGVAAQAPDHVTAQVGPMGASALLPALSRRAVSDGLAQAQELFRAAVGTRSRVSWRSALEPGLAFLASHARAADLVVVGRGCPDGATGCPLPLDAASVVLVAGRPVLVVPPGIDYLEGRRVMVAWKDTREARRAVLDALPILRLADRVDVVAITHEDRVSGAADVATYLSAQGIPATSAEHPCEGGSDAEVLLDLASEGATDLIVMGAYGHGRLREDVLGGVTREVLRHCPVCSFLSH
ncbi:universal stress protein [Methylobacterium sp. E-066]|uniref:universal stress protein n=1 Tax=Methylobacterium sp. E-066 TaxID=2836584 RepID=UPI001FBB3B9F|nr:universal stress protein [Methylobacterium sp. E-066]MCJ2139343.1 universal stress protein [Methylobacterium sp. E-066]